jgi:phosphatidate cytidylyltransferase
MLIKRIITGFVLGVLVTSGVLWLPQNGFNLLTTLIIMVAAWEYIGFWENKNYVKRLGFLLFFLFLYSVFSLFATKAILIFGGLWWLMVPFFLWYYALDKRKYFTNTLDQWLVGVMIFMPCLFGLIELQEKFGAKFLLYLLAIICAMDIGAYFAGRFFGKHLLAVQISPKKTFEGLLGGLFFALIIAYSGVFLFIPSGSIIYKISFLLLIIITCLWSVIGDLFESMLKRQVGIKDSGKILPGHGGVYDRIDSLTAAIPIFVLGFLLISW